MYFFKGLILELGVDCSIIALDDVVSLSDGSEYEKQAIEFEKNDKVLDAVKTLFEGLGITFTCIPACNRFLDGRKLEVYRITDFKRI